VALVNLQQAQEKYRQNCPTYATGIDATTRTCPGNLVGSGASEHGYYRIAITAPTTAAPSGLAYTLTATAQNEQANDTDCASFTIDQNGVKSPADCWK
jgi:Tfp pilus assembly protein PilE